MPTGYTAKVESGAITELRDFAILCSRAMLVNIDMRDDPFDAPIRTYEPSANRRERLDSALARLQELEVMTPAQKEAAAALEHREFLERRLERKKDTRTVRTRYTAMLEKVRAWEPPSEEHVGFKAYMIEQLESSIQFDCGDGTESSDPIRLTSEKWFERELTHTRNEVECATEGWQQEQDRVEYCNRWNRALAKSFQTKTG